MARRPLRQTDTEGAVIKSNKSSNVEMGEGSQDASMTLKIAVFAPMPMPE